MGKEFDVALGSKIKALRSSLDLTLEQASERLGYKNYQVLSDIEKGKRTLKASELSTIAKLFHKDIGFFLSEQTIESEELLVRWRDCSNLKDRKEKEAEFRTYCHNYYDLEERLGFEHKHSLEQLNLDGSDLQNYEKINKIAREKALQLELGSRPACVLRKILEEDHNVKVMFLEMSNHGSAASVVGRFGAAIVVNSREPKGRRNYDLAHEMFHLMTWERFSSDEFSFGGAKYDALEKTAESFAAALLMPDQYIRQEFEEKFKDGRVPLVDIVGMANEFHVSVDALLWRLVNLRLLEKNPVKKLLTEDRHKISAVKDFSSNCDCEENVEFLSERYIYLAVKAFKEGLISKSKMASYLKINVADVEQVLSKSGYTLEDESNEELAVTRR